MKHYQLMILVLLALVLPAQAAKYYTDWVVEDGKIQMKERTASPSIVASYGFLYPKTDNRLYYLDDTGLESDVLLGGNSDLEDLNNISTAGKATGDVLRFDGVNWVNSENLYLFDNGLGLGASPDLSTIFDVTSNTLGSRPCPRLSLASRDLIASPAQGLCIFNTTSGVYQNFDGTAWKSMGSGLFAWITANAYATGDVVHVGGKIYNTLISHTSGTFATDLAALRWQELSDDLNRETAVSDSAIVLWDGTGGDDVKNSVVGISATGSMTGISNLTYSGSLFTPLTADRIPYITSSGALATTPGLVYLASDSSISLAGPMTVDNGSIYLGNRADAASTFVGASSGSLNTSAAIRNVAVGLNTLFSNTGGDNNTFVGWTAGEVLTGANNNVGIGSSALGMNQTGNDNVAVGSSALGLNTAAGNVAVGHTAVGANTSGTGHVGVGYQALGTVSTGTNNTALGYQAGNATTGSGNLFLGYQAGNQFTGSNQGFIDNSGTTNPLIHMDFASDVATINGRLVATSTLVASNPCPDMTTAQKNAIASPGDGDCVYDTDLHKWNTYNALTGTWKSAGGADGLTNTRVPYTNASGDLVDEAVFNYIATADLLSVPNLTVTNATADLLIAGTVNGATGSFTALMTAKSIQAIGDTVASIPCNRMTTTQRNTLGASLGSADEGKCVYDTTLDKECRWTGSAWTIETSTPDLIVAPGAGANQIKICSYAIGGAGSRHSTCTSNPCTVRSELNDCVSSVNWNSTGNYTTNFNTGYWSGADTYNCTATTIEYSVDGATPTQTTGAQTQNAYYIGCKKMQSAGFENCAISVTCMGY